MKIEIDLADLGFHYDENGDAVRNKSLNEAIVEHASRKVADAISRRQDLTDAIKKTVNQQVLATVTEALARPIQRTSAWGEKNGEPTTVLEIAREHLEKFLNNKNTRTSYDRSPQNLSEIIQDATSKVMGKELQEAVKQAKEQIKTHIFDKALAAAVAELSKVK